MSIRTGSIIILGFSTFIYVLIVALTIILASLPLFNKKTPDVPGVQSSFTLGWWVSCLISVFYLHIYIRGFNGLLKRNPTPLIMVSYVQLIDSTITFISVLFNIVALLTGSYKITDPENGQEVDGKTMKSIIGYTVWGLLIGISLNLYNTLTIISYTRRLISETNFADEYFAEEMNRNIDLDADGKPVPKYIRIKNNITYKLIGLGKKIWFDGNDYISTGRTEGISLVN